MTCQHEWGGSPEGPICLKCKHPKPPQGSHEALQARIEDLETQLGQLAFLLGRATGYASHRVMCAFPADPAKCTCELAKLEREIGELLYGRT